MNALLLLTIVSKTVTTLETVEGIAAAVILATHWTLMDTRAMVLSIIS